MTKMTALCGMIGMALLVPTLASAQSTDATYCAALVKKYDAYLEANAGRSQQPQSVDARVGAERCRTGDARGIAPLEQALKNAKIDLPPRS